jgi:hypothetical protein
MSSAEEILELVKSGSLSVSDAQEKLARLKLADLKKVTYKISPKGAISFYGIRRMPITLYNEELKQIMDIANTSEFNDFISQNSNKLSSKEKNQKND